MSERVLTPVDGTLIQAETMPDLESFQINGLLPAHPTVRTATGLTGNPMHAFGAAWSGVIPPGPPTPMPARKTSCITLRRGQCCGKPENLHP
jgi:hypothetical protein